MMQAEVIKNGAVAGTHDIDLAMPIRDEGSVLLQLHGESRKLSAVAADFEDAAGIRISDGREFTGYGNVIVLYRMDAATVQIRIKE